MHDFQNKNFKLVSARLVYRRCGCLIACILWDSLTIINKINLGNWFIVVADYSCRTSRGTGYLAIIVN